MAQEQKKFGTVRVSRCANGYMIEAVDGGNCGDSGSLIANIHIAKDIPELSKIIDKLIGKPEGGIK